MQEIFQRFFAQHMEEGLRKFRALKKLDASPTRTRNHRVVKTEDIAMEEFHTMGADHSPMREKAKVRPPRARTSRWRRSTPARRRSRRSRRPRPERRAPEALRISTS